jgi:hypothetical protein
MTKSGELRVETRLAAEHAPRRAGILLAVLDRAVGRLEADFAVSAVAKWPVCAPPTATQGKCRFARQVVLIAVNIDDFDNPVGIVDPQRAIGTDGNLNLRHEASG